ncbi:peptidoglycan-binding protein [Aquincola sp. S2]|uniref:Peptidoglycan-binding protein n=2 Tax=Pseudaquabacterium terrae TaxID=2732868 RepID=A0ABX2ELZ5_9BURK|nr:peptidoglycan-binding protein [Aquabacterium terrae]
MISVQDAAGIPGAAVLRLPQTGKIGHIVLSDGRGGTVEAHSSARGVVADTLSGRRWDFGVLVPGLRYFRGEAVVVLDPPPALVLRLTSPPTRGALVQALQHVLADRGFAVGAVDGVFGPQTAHAVRAFQDSQGLVADGEAGPATLAALGLR